VILFIEWFLIGKIEKFQSMHFIMTLHPAFAAAATNFMKYLAPVKPPGKKLQTKYKNAMNSIPKVIRAHIKLLRIIETYIFATRLPIKHHANTHR